MTSPASQRLISERAVRPLVRAGAIRSAKILGQPGGWAVLLRRDTVMEQAVMSARGQHMRLWKHLNAAAAFLKDRVGLSRFEVDATAYEPGIAPGRGLPRTSLPRGAAAHDLWFRQKVQQALDGAEDGSNPILSMPDLHGRLQALRLDLEGRTRERQE